MVHLLSNPNKRAFKLIPYHDRVSVRPWDPYPRWPLPATAGSSAVVGYMTETLSLDAPGFRFSDLEAEGPLNRVGVPPASTRLVPEAAFRVPGLRPTGSPSGTPSFPSTPPLIT